MGMNLSSHDVKSKYIKSCVCSIPSDSDFPWGCQPCYTHTDRMLVSGCLVPIKGQRWDQVKVSIQAKDQNLDLPPSPREPTGELVTLLSPLL